MGKEEGDRKCIKIMVCDDIYDVFLMPPKIPSATSGRCPSHPRFLIDQQMNTMQTKFKVILPPGGQTHVLFESSKVEISFQFQMYFEIYYYNLYIIRHCLTSFIYVTNFLFQLHSRHYFEHWGHHRESPCSHRIYMLQGGNRKTSRSIGEKISGRECRCEDNTAVGYDGE